MVRAVIFDLDNCLAAANEVGEELFSPAFEAIRQANRGAVSERTLARAFADSWRHPLDWVASQYGFSKEMLDAGWKVFERLEVKKAMRGYGDLWVISELPAKLFLVTSGFRKLQESKIRALGLQPLFEGIFVDAIDEPGRKGKQGIFEEILASFRLSPPEVLAVGDNPDSELLVGRRLGMKTVQTLRPGVEKAEDATFWVRSLTELKSLPVWD